MIAVKWYRFHVVTDFFSFKSEHKIFQNFQKKKRYACSLTVKCISKDIYAKVCTKKQKYKCYNSFNQFMMKATQNAHISCRRWIAFYSHRNLRLFITSKRFVYLFWCVCVCFTLISVQQFHGCCIFHHHRHYHILSLFFSSPFLQFVCVV